MISGEKIIDLKKNKVFIDLIYSWRYDSSKLVEA
jgi:hypothetical protein